ncbi:MAG: helix-turn-helix domain-containing protein [Candidatus Izemoplasmatales bacterium]|nr:helix-turn-helix domain-containing protein [Candidatus Izemoplasmatales bacterium]
MGRPKGGKNLYWSKEAKYEYVQLVLNGEVGVRELGRQNHVSNGMISRWVKKYKAGGIEALENKKKPGNPMAKYQKRKELTAFEQLEYENMKLRIEVERLKKGYTEAEVMSIRRKKSSK